MNIEHVGLQWFLFMWAIVSIVFVVRAIYKHWPFVMKGELERCERFQEADMKSFRTTLEFRADDIQDIRKVNRVQDQELADLRHDFNYIKCRLDSQDAKEESGPDESS